VLSCQIDRNPSKHGACGANHMGVFLMVYVVAGGVR
jgi:hypothetical protein